MSQTKPPLPSSPRSPTLHLRQNDSGFEIVGAIQQDHTIVKALHSAIEELLPGDIRRRERRQISIDEFFSWQLAWADESITVTVLDQTGSPCGPSISITPFELVDALFHAALGQNQDLLRALDRLRHWIQALDAGDCGPQPDAPKPRVTCSEPSPPLLPKALPVSALRHLAYRETWASFYHGTAAVIPHSNHVAVFDRDGLHLVSRETGGRISAQKGLYPADAPFLALDTDGRMTAFDVHGGIRWRSVATVEGLTKHTVVSSEAILLEGDRTQLSAFDPDTGQLLWRHCAFWGGGQHPCVMGDLVWRLADDGFLYALWTQTGVIYCRRRLLGRPVGGVLATTSGPLVTTAVGDAIQCTQFEPIGGQTLWQRRIRGRLVAGPIVYHGGVALVIERDGRQVVHQLAAEEGTQRNHHLLDEGTEILRLDIVDGLLLSKSTTGAVHAFDSDSGQYRWSLGPDEPHHPPWARLGPITARGFLLCAGASLRAVDPHTGRQIQTLPCGELTPSWVSAWENGDLLVLEDDVLRLFRLHGHLALLD